MSNTDYLVDYIRRHIPGSILRKGFLERDNLNYLNPNLGHVIKTKILRDWVLKDINLVSGIEATIDITNRPIQTVSLGQIIDVGYDTTGGKDIVTVLSVGYGINALTGGLPGIVSAVVEPFQVTDARCSVVAPNIIYVEGYIGVTLTTLKCILSIDPEFTNISPRAMTTLATMCLLATKAYLHTNLILNLHNAEVVAGVDYGAILEIVSTYAEANEEYEKIRDTTWKKVLILTDPMAKNRAIRLLMR